MKEEKKALFQKIEDFINEKLERIEEIQKEMQFPEISGYLQEELVKCGKANCKCNSGHFHGPYWYFYQYDSTKSSKLRKIYVGTAKESNAFLNNLRIGINNKKHNEALQKEITILEKEIQKIEKRKYKIMNEIDKIF